MHETFTTPEVAQRMPVESLEQTVARLRDTEAFAPVTAASTSIDLAYEPITYSDGRTHWSRSYGSLQNYELVDPTTHTEAYMEAVTAIHDDQITLEGIAKEARWWDSNYVNLHEAAQKGVTDAVEIGDGERALDVLNFSEQAMTEQEVQEFKAALESVVQMTNGKVFDRVKGVALLPAAHFPGGNGASFSNYGRILAVNIDQLRADVAFLAENEAVASRYGRYFEQTEPMYQIFLTHELGHALDISTEVESENWGIETEEAEGRLGSTVSGISAFQDKFGWKKYHTHQGEHIHKHSWRVDDAIASEVRERPVTSYAASHPAEDFAETFALMACGGDVSSIPGRVAAVERTIQQSEGQESSSDNPLQAVYQPASAELTLQAKFKPAYSVAVVQRK